MTILLTIVTSNFTCYRRYGDMLVIHVLNKEKRCGGRSITAKSNVFYQLSRNRFGHFRNMKCSLSDSNCAVYPNQKPERSHWTKATERKRIQLKTWRCIELRSAQLRIGWNVLFVRSRQFQQSADKLRRFVCVRRDAPILWTVVKWTSPTCLCFLVQNTPNDLQLLSDVPAHHNFCLLGPVDPFQTSLPLVYCAW